ncbi:adenosylhomocysteine nucleosidase [Melghiribacillus thermohalophilus]|uniref:5'-methylthioadenosine/S-adenosylhomocysteine nucleosidase n=1 Tax=Melghiribacillus thermohalophilus TaxID=1324956 RepID=A0A4R3NEF7_9BACI|nr:5'-methylthioadenosine/S-adenosylhomocysteine nucleosidase [Melghiribacillus thermohalophilus]TCT27065.1 adenosylhomocysteine nucleosidase [Melghiribacillus thermohalophilus]
MTIGIIGAMDEEVELLKQSMDIQREITKGGCQFFEGTLKGKAVILLKSGIGKVNAAMSTTILHERYHPDYVINTGSAGGFSAELEVGDLIISDRVLHHDVDVTVFNYAYGQVPGMPPHYEADERLISLAISAAGSIKGIQAVKGLIATGDSFMNEEGRIEFIRKQFPDMQAAEMEAAAIAQVCYQYGTPFVIVRSLSDIAGKESHISFEKYLSQAAQHSAQLIMEMLKDI